jgi:hypothetical protein
MTLETLIASVGVLGALQTGYVMLKNMEARTVNGPTAWAASDDDFVVESETDRAARQMKADFDLARAKSIMATASQFAERKITL